MAQRAGVPDIFCIAKLSEALRTPLPDAILVYIIASSGSSTISNPSARRRRGGLSFNTCTCIFEHSKCALG